MTTPEPNIARQRGKRKWSLWRAALYGLIASILVFVINTLADEGKDLSLWLNARPGQMIGYFAGRLLFIPILFILVAFIRNCFVKTSPDVRNDDWSEADKEEFKRLRDRQR